METSDYISAISALISVIAMLVTLWQTIISKKSYNLEKQKCNEDKPNFKIISPIDSKAIIDKGEKVKLQYYLVVTNLSNKDMTIDKISLNVIGEEKSVVLLPTNKSSMLFVGDNIECNKSIQKWVEFEISKELYYNLKIIKFVIEIEDVFKNKRDTTIIYMNEEVEENVKA